MWLIVYWRAILDCQLVPRSTIPSLLETFLAAFGLKRRGFKKERSQYGTERGSAGCWSQR
jgi:hypothetical protein